MMNFVKFLRTLVAGRVPTTSQLDYGQIAINTTDGKVFIAKDTAGTKSIIAINDAANVSNTPAGAVTATNVQAAINQLNDTFVKSETSVTKYVSDLAGSGSDSNNGNTIFTPYLTIGKAWTDITPSGQVKVLGASTYNVNHNFAASKTSIKTQLDPGTKITGTIGFVSGNTSMQFVNGKVQATINDASTGTQYWSNVDLSGSTLNFSAGGYKQISGSSSAPTLITLSNLASGSGTLELNNIIGGIVPVSVGTGWTVIYRNTIISPVGTVNGIIVEANNVFVNAIVTSQAALDAITLDGYYILNFANPVISGLSVAKGDVIYKAGTTRLIVYKFGYAPAVFSVIDPANVAQRYSWAKSADGWIQVGTGGGGSTAWGSITGTLSNQTDLQTALNAKEPTITAGTTSQYWRGDKTFQTLDKNAVGLSDVDNTSDANKPISNATQTALNAKQDLLGITPSTSNAHQVVRINPAGDGFSTANNIVTYTTSGRNALSNVPLNLVIYNSDSQVFEKYNGTGWDSVGLGFTNFYAGDFLATNFATGVLTITSSTHGLGATKDLNVKVLNASNVDVTSGVLLTLNENGNITVEVAQGLEFNGRVLITKVSTTPYTNTLPDASVTQAKLVSYVNESLLPVGTVIPIVGFSAPNANFLLADGSLLLRASYPALWALLNQGKGSVTTTIATPAVLTNTNHGLYDGARVFLTTSGALPTGLAANTSYFVRRIDANTFNLATTYANLQAGIYINTSGTQSGAHVLNFAPFGVTNSTNFRLPDLRGLALAGAGITNTVLSISARSIGANFGQESVTLTAAQSGVPAHSHPISDPGHFHSYDKKDTAVQSNIASGGTLDAENDNTGYTVTSTNTKTTGITVNNNTAVNAAEAHNNMQPTLFVNYYIKVL